MQPVERERGTVEAGGAFKCCKYTFEFNQVHHVASSVYWWAALQETSSAS